jgi:hypothetical protein
VSAQTWQETLIWAVGDGTALTASTTPTSLIPLAAKWTAPANYFNYVGKTLRVTAKGRISNIVTTPGTLTLDVRMGTSTVIFNGGAIQLNAVAKTNVTWWFEAELVFRTLGNGAASNFLGIGQFTSEAVVGAGTGAAGSTGNGAVNLPATAPAVGTSFDAGTANPIDFFGTFSLNNANSIQVHTYKLESLN